MRTRRDGSFRTVLRVPRRPPGSYFVSARTGTFARARFRIARPPQTMVAAGDIACRPTEPMQPLACRHGPMSDRVIALAPDVVAPLGDVQYGAATAAEFAGSYDPTWGRFRAITRPVPGNHEYDGVPDRTRADGYFGYFGGAAGPPAQGYYTYEVGDWQAIALNTGALGYTRALDTLPDDCYPVSCAQGSAQLIWLRGVLDSLPADKCVVAYWHHPRFSSTISFSHRELTAVYDALRDGGAELALTGHSHAYERFAPMDAHGRPDRKHGVREFVVGTGGKNRRFEDTSGAPGSEFRLPAAAGFGVLKLRLFVDRYRFRLVGEGGEVLDRGGERCHGRPR